MALTIDNTTGIGVLFGALDTTSLRSNAAITALQSGITLMQSKKYKEAAGQFKIAAAYDPTNTDAYNFMAQADMSAGDHKSAINAYKLSLQIFAAGQSTGTSGTTQDQTQVFLANIYISDKRPVDAINLLKAALRTNPQNIVVPYTLGQLLNQQGSPKEAEPYYRQAVKLAPKDGNAYYGLGTSLEQQGKNSDAILAFQKAISFKKDFSAAIYELGNVYAKTGQKDKAQNEITALQKINTSVSNSDVALLQSAIKQPKIVTIDNTSKSSFNTLLGPVQSLVAVDSQLVQPDSSKEMSVTFLFDSSMDPASVNNISNWTIRKAQGSLISPTTGIYDNGAYRSTDVAVPPIPTRVLYDQTTQEATVYFPIRQNSTATGTIDTKRIIFTFNGKDINGKSMDPTANQIDGYSKIAF
jgi:tetratricopeptide (TPR) repeat protein